MLEEVEKQKLKENNLPFNFNFSTSTLWNCAKEFFANEYPCFIFFFKSMEIIILIRDLWFLIIKIIEVNR